MASKFQFISELADHTAHSVTKNAAAWKNYLDTASRLYKYSFDLPFFKSLNHFLMEPL